MSSDPPIDNDPDLKAYESWCDDQMKRQLTVLAKAGWLPSQDIVRSVGSYALERIKELESEVADFEQIVAGQDERIAEAGRTIERLIAERDEHGHNWTMRVIDRVNGVAGHFCVARTIPSIYSEFWSDTLGWCSAGTVYVGREAAEEKLKELM